MQVQAQERLRLSDLPDVLTPEEVASVLQCARTTVYDLCRTGRIPSVKVGRLVRIPRERFVRWLNGERETA
ncbi:MAG: hypothetical protein BAA04_09740 [Firmicutes bacterium ZCTH02-B6]|nr:MAG: hypothetical protein BAA04_09740 [Firmicutes bacterium ZCTH02-B6]